MTFQSLLDDAFPMATDANLVRGVTEGIMLADTTMDGAGFLKSLVGLDIRGHLRRAGILFRIHEMVLHGDLPFACAMSQMPRGNWHWIELRSKQFTSHVCRTEGPELFPVDTPTRQDDRLSNQGDLFRDSHAVIPIRGYAAWLTFGVGDSGMLSHLCWGMPSAEHDVWLARTNILRRAAENEVAVAFEAPPRVTALKFRDHVEEALNSKSEKSDKPA